MRVLIFIDVDRDRAEINRKSRMFFLLRQLKLDLDFQSISFLFLVHAGQQPRDKASECDRLIVVAANRQVAGAVTLRPLSTTDYNVSLCYQRVQKPRLIILAQVVAFSKAKSGVIGGGRNGEPDAKSRENLVQQL